MATAATPRRQPGRYASLAPFAIRYGILAVIIIAWQTVGDDTARIRMPTFTRSAKSLWAMIANGELPAALLQSNVALFWGYLLALVVAVPLGIGMGSIRLLDRVVSPYLIILISTPLIAVLPVLQAVFGLGLGTRIVVVFLFAFVYIAMNTAVGIRLVPDELKEMARSFGATRMQLMTRVVLPAAFPTIMAGARIGIGRGVVGMVIAELFLVSSGLGSLLSFYMTRFDAGSVLAIALTMVLEGVLVIALARKLEAMLTRRW